MEERKVYLLEELETFVEKKNISMEKKRVRINFSYMKNGMKEKKLRAKH